VKDVIKEKSFSFALRIVKLYKFLCNQHREFVLSKQMLKSGTSIGANIRESKNAESAKDFIHKLHIAQKECFETIYWLEILYHSEFISKKEFSSINDDASELLKLLKSSILTKKQNLKKVHRS
jgi:four helix bundle protein